MHTAGGMPSRPKGMVRPRIGVAEQEDSALVHWPGACGLLLSVGLAADVARYGVYDGADEGLDYLVPWYLASSRYQFSDNGPFDDIEHTCDVGGLVVRAAWSARACGAETAELDATAAALVESCAADLEDWHRPSGPDTGLSEWRLSPPRKFNWWFGTTSDMSWLLASE